MIGSMEGAESLDLQGENHSQNNFVRGACKLGMMPCNGMLYVPPDQCFCQPGAKQLGLTAIAGADAGSYKPVPDNQRLERGPAFGKIPNSKSEISDSADWPTFRHDAARHGASSGPVSATLKDGWHAKLGGKLSAPVSVEGRVYVASVDAHTIHALDLQSGKPLWDCVAGGRIDSPPTVEKGLVLFGSADGRVYCVRAEDGALVWRFLAAPCDRRIGCFDQIESTWHVHGSVLMCDGVAYVTADRSTYLDGGIRLYGLDPVTGKILYQNNLVGPFPDGNKTVPRDVSFYIHGANSDVLVSEGNDIYMRQKRLSLSLQEQQSETLSSKGEADVDLHMFSTSGLLDDSWYNRAF
jgi:outer membrane protein assembly factor BamB